MRLMRSPGFPGGHTDVSAFSAAPCVSAAWMVRARRDGADPLSHPAHLPRTQGALSIASINTTASTHPSSAPTGPLLPNGEKRPCPSEVFDAQ
jgi:hypothetical protein